MTMRPHVAAALAVVLLGPRLAGAGEKEVCIDAHEHSQIARRDGRLLQAQRDLVTCARAEARSRRTPRGT